MKFRDVAETLVERGVITIRNDRYEFRYGYFYYYFVARALNETLETADGKQEVAKLTDRLTEEDPANVLLFLTHFSKNEAIIRPMIAHADRLFVEGERATLNVDELGFAGIDESIQKVVYQDQPIDEARAAYLEALDNSENQITGDAPRRASAERNVEIAAVGNIMQRIDEAFRTMQILGQLLKNFPGTLDVDPKTQITDAVYGIGLRLLRTIHSMVHDNPDETIKAVIEGIRAQHPELSQSELFDRARQTISWYVYVSSYSVVQRIAMNVGTPLLDPVFERLENDYPTPAVRLISSAIRLDRAGKFPEERINSQAKDFRKNPLAVRILQALVNTHFHLFEVATDLRQKVCHTLGMQFMPTTPQIRSRARLLSPIRKQKND